MEMTVTRFDNEKKIVGWKDCGQEKKFLLG